MTIDCKIKLPNNIHHKINFHSTSDKIWYSYLYLHCRCLWWANAWPNFALLSNSAENQW